MKSIVRCVLTLGIVLTASASATVADEPKEKGIPCDTKQLDEKWNLKLKSLKTHLPLQAFSEGEVRIVFEFTKDVDEDTVKTIRKAFEGDGQPFVQCCFFDRDNIVISKRRFTSIKGEVTGKPGEAFAVIVMKCPEGIILKTKKIELRLAKDEK
jgi:hypothetical protein